MIDGQVLSEPDRDALLQWAQRQDHRAGELLFRAGDPGDRIYLVLHGGLVIERPVQAGKAGFNERLGPGELAGVLAFFSGAENRFDIRCVSDSRFACLLKSDYDAILAESPALWRRLQQVGLLRMRMIHLSSHLDRLFGPFGAMMPHILRDIEADIEWLTLNSGETLFERGATDGNAFIVMTGRLQMVIVQPDGREALYGTVVSGETVGEVALLTGQPQAHTVFAARDSELVRLSKRSFELMLQRNTRAIHNVSRILGKRLADGPVDRDPSRMPIRCIALIPAAHDVMLDEFASLLEERLRDYGSTLHLNSLVIERELTAQGIAQAAGDEAAGLRLTQWLSDQEERWRYLVYQADAQWGPWSARCMRQSDEVVVVADSTAEPCLQEVAARLSGARQRWSLVLLHPPDLDRPRNTGLWLRHADVGAIFHVRRNNQADLARLARTLTGNAVSLVLGGGGARGFAHIGVLRALEQVGIPVDMVGGTSMGAPIAGFVAQGARGEEVNARAGQAFHNIIDYTLPIVSLISGARVSASIRQQTGEWDIEDYWLPFFCVSTNLTTGQSMIHRRGDSWRAVRSSVSIPGIMPPVACDGALLVDGAVLNNLPVDVMREMNPFGTLIAVDVTPPTGPAAPSEYTMGLSGWRVLADKLLPWRKSVAVPGIASTILQATVAGSALKRQQVLEQKLVDLYLNINVESVGALQFDAREQAAQLGYEGSIEPLQEWSDENLSWLLGTREGA